MDKGQLENKKAQLLKELELYKISFERTVGAIALIEVLIAELAIPQVTLQTDKTEGK